MLEGFHRRVSQIVLKAIEPYGFALGGGYALQVYGIVDRPSKDIDNYASQADEKLFNDEETAVRKALKDEGLNSVVGYRDSWFKALQVFNPVTEEAIVVDLGYDYRENEPVIIADLGPVLDIEDVITGKVRAFWDCRAARDYIDIDTILQTGRWTPSDLLTSLRRVRPEASAEIFAEALRAVDAIDNNEYEEYHLNQEDIAKMVTGLELAAKQIVCQ
jgi:hypothetical protein